MTRRERLGVLGSIVWVIIVLVTAISRPSEHFFFISYMFGALPVAVGWLIYLSLKEICFSKKNR
jgi:hypothetical protein